MERPQEPSSEKVRALLKKHGLQHTQDRESLLVELHKPRTWSPLQLMEVLQNSSKATIYNNLNTFLKKGLIQETHHHDNTAHYELAERGHHDHKLCSNCHVTECVACVIPTVPDHHLELTGLCTTCA